MVEAGDCVLRRYWFVGLIPSRFNEVGMVVREFWNEPYSEGDIYWCLASTGRR